MVINYNVTSNCSFLQVLWAIINRQTANAIWRLYGKHHCISLLLGLGLVEDNFLLVVDTNNGTIHQLDLSDESIWQLPLSEMNYPVAVQFNPTDRKVYWTELRENIIKSSYLNGTDEKTISTLHRGSFLVGLAIDMVSGLVYFTEGGADIIAAVTLDGRQHFTLVTEDMDEPQDIVLDLERGMMYWTDKGESPRIEKASMNGNDRSLVIDFEFRAVPVGLAIDSNGERLFWCDASLDKIQSISLSDGQKTSVIMHLYSPGLQHFGIALLGDNLYFTGVRKNYVSRINVKDSSPIAVRVGPSNFNMSSGITAYRSTRRTNGFEANSVCSVRNGDCEQICLATPNGPQCACENGFTTAKTCSIPTCE
ncbi:hypothetical protein NP493_1573g00011 [Ridgeia piscesae]|uniref:Vitellogenin receptor n=1 Tax=Ridgeia piscesae TaxID=27915 RepID=A0AAD9N915_RIDPI|nr:hypothetical protein NP493_1573g00011 [Ridgeia piscesae]